MALKQSAKGTNVGKNLSQEASVDVVTTDVEQYADDANVAGSLFQRAGLPFDRTVAQGLSDLRTSVDEASRVQFDILSTVVLRLRRTELELADSHELTRQLGAMMEEQEVQDAVKKFGRAGLPWEKIAALVGPLGGPLVKVAVEAALKHFGV